MSKHWPCGKLGRVTAWLILVEKTGYNANRHRILKAEELLEGRSRYSSSLLCDFEGDGTGFCTAPDPVSDVEKL